MSDRLKLPLNQESATRADDEFYAHHPELVQDGKRIPLDANDPAQANLREEWIDLYVANGGKLEATAPSKKPADIIQSCLICAADKGLLVVNVVDPHGLPIEGALVSANGLRKTTDLRGIADFGAVDAGVYTITARKDDYRMFGPYEDTAEVKPQGTSTATLGLAPCIMFRLEGRFKIAQALEYNPAPPSTKFSIVDRVGDRVELDLYQDSTFGFGRPLPSGDEVSTKEEELKNAMTGLLGLFGFYDDGAIASRAFDAFQKKNSSLTIYTDPALDKAIENSVNFSDFAELVLGAPGTKGAHPKQPRIHQYLAGDEWDINQRVFIEDLGAPALNHGSLFYFSGDYSNGLVITIDAVQYVFVFVDDYHYDACKQQYKIKLTFELYDVFGLDDEDLAKFGRSGSKVPWYARLYSIPSVSTRIAITTLEDGFTAWWQLQHQFNYAPMVTKAVISKEFTVSTAPK
jgi:predicted Zn-dependent protease with MMP-like domain